MDRDHPESRKGRRKSSPLFLFSFHGEYYSSTLSNMRDDLPIFTQNRLEISVLPFHCSFLSYCFMWKQRTTDKATSTAVALPLRTARGRPVHTKGRMGNRPIRPGLREHGGSCYRRASQAQQENASNLAGLKLTGARTIPAPVLGRATTVTFLTGATPPQRHLNTCLDRYGSRCHDHAIRGRPTPTTTRAIDPVPTRSRPTPLTCVPGLHDRGGVRLGDNRVVYARGLCP